MYDVLAPADINPRHCLPALHIHCAQKQQSLIFLPLHPHMHPQVHGLHAMLRYLGKQAHLHLVRLFIIKLCKLYLIPASRNDTNCTPLTTRPSFTSRHGIIRFVSTPPPLLTIVLISTRLTHLIFQDGIAYL
ncbi:hypothetical protein LSPH24S_09831 [Lysinibacillus sphaericus]